MEQKKEEKTDSKLKQPVQQQQSKVDSKPGEMEFANYKNGYCFRTKIREVPRVRLTGAQADSFGLGCTYGTTDETRTMPFLGHDLEETVAWKNRHLLPIGYKIMRHHLKADILCAVFSNGTLIPLISEECKEVKDILVYHYGILSTAYENQCLPFIKLTEKQLFAFGYSLMTNYRWALFARSTSYNKGYWKAILKIVNDGYIYPDKNAANSILFDLEAAGHPNCFAVVWPYRTNHSMTLLDVTTLKGASAIDPNAKAEEVRRIANLTCKRYRCMDCLSPAPVAMIDQAGEIHWALLEKGELKATTVTKPTGSNSSNSGDKKPVPPSLIDTID